MTSPARFRTLRKLMAPRWLTDDEGELIGYSLDVAKDAFVERLRLGHLARFPQNGPNGELAPSDALVALGRDRREIRGLFETEAAYAKRQLRYLDDRVKQGSPYMLMQKLAEYLGPLPSYRTVDARGNWYTRAANGTESALLKQANWNWDGSALGERWSRFWVIIYPNGLWTASTYDWGEGGSPNWGASTETWGTTATSEHVETVRYLVSDWMPAGTRCVNIIIALDPASFNPASPEPDGLWEHWGKVVDGVRVASRLSTARYWSGVTR